MSEMAELLQRFVADHSTEDRRLESVRAQAEFLGVSAPQLSRLRNGQVPLTTRMARQFADRLGRTPDQRDRVYRDLMRLTEVATDRGAVVLAAVRLQEPVNRNPFDATMVP